MKAKTLKSETVYEGPLFDVRRDQVELDTGMVRSYEVVDHPGSVTIAPVDPSGNLIFVRQYRHPIAMDLLEFPAGTLEAGEDPEACAIREAREEIGMRPGKLDLLGEVFLAPGYSGERSYLFLARDLQKDPLSPDSDENLSLEYGSVDQVYDWIASGELLDAKTLAALLLALPLVDEQA
jgi:ADP-ribose pyrophosphatase